LEARPWHRHYDYSVPTTMRYPQLTIQDFLQIAANTRPDRAALNFYGTEMTYRELRYQSLRMANALGALGVKKGDRVGLHLPNCPQYIIAYYSVLFLGAIVVNMNPMYTVNEMKHIIQTTGITTLVTFDDVLPNIHTLSRDTEIPRVVVTRVVDFIRGMVQSTASELELEEGWHHFSQLLEGCSNTKIPRVKINSKDPAVIIFTGGTTGRPKGAVLTHANYVAATMQVSAWGDVVYKRINPQLRSVLTALPFFHIYANLLCLNWSVFNYSTMILVPRFEINAIMELIAKFDKIAFFPAVPTMLSAIFNHPKACQLDLDKKFGVVHSGGAAMPVELIEQIKDMGIFFSEGWGMTETTSLGTSYPLIGLKKVGSIGVPYIDADIRLMDLKEGVEEVPQGEPGELIIKSPTVMQGYWNNAEETADQLRDGWLYTGDIAVRDKDDYLFIVDRKKDMIIAGGYNIYPREIDEVLYQHPKIKEGISVGIPDKYRGETVKAFVILKKGEAATEEDIINYCKEKLASYKVPKTVEFRRELPKSPVGKILRKILLDEEIRK